MSRRVVQYIEISDDFDKEVRAEDTIEIAIDGTVYEIDCSAAKAQEARDYLAQFAEVAHDRWKMPPRPGKKGRSITANALVTQKVEKPTPYTGMTGMLRDRSTRNEIREWCNANGHPCSKIGKIPTEGLREYMESHPDAYVPESTLVDAGLKEIADAV